MVAPAPGLSPAPDVGPDAKGVLGQTGTALDTEVAQAQAQTLAALDPYVGTTHEEQYGPQLDPSVPVSPQEPFAPVAPPPAPANPLDIGPLPGLTAPVSNQASLGLIGTAQAGTMTSDEIATAAQTPSTNLGIAISHALANAQTENQRSCSGGCAGRQGGLAGSCSRHDANAGCARCQSHWRSQSRL